MNIPSRQNLIVCAISSQTAPRHYVLAAVASLVLCGAARAQLSPAAPPLSVLPAVEILGSAQYGEVLTLQQSPSLRQWQSLDTPQFGSGESIRFLLPASTETEGEYFRFRLDTRPLIGKARWEVAGLSLTLNDGPSSRLVSLLPGGAGSMTSDQNLQPFTWDWKRTGMDTGTLAIIWPGGARDSYELEHLSEQSGVFVARTDAGSGSVSAGSFRINPAGALPSTAPAVLEKVRIDVTGSGRATCLVIGGTGTAERSSPFGPETYSMVYSRTGSHTATLELNGYPASQIISFTFTGPACGKCVTREMRNGVLRRESEGTFTLTAQP